MKIKEIQKEYAFKHFKIEIEIESADDLLWLYGVSGNSVSMTERSLDEMGVTHEFSGDNREFQREFYTAMKDLYERKILQNS